MTLIANSKASLSAGLNSTKNQPAVSNASGGGSSTFSLALDDTDSDFVSQMDLDGLVPISKSALETAVLELDDASKDNHAAPVADAVWLANWFQKNAPATASSPAPSLGSSSAPVEPAQVETASKPVATPSSELIAPIGVPISDQSKKSPSVLPDKPASALAPSSATAPLTAAVRMPLPTPSAAQAIYQPTAQVATQPVAQSVSIGVGFWDSRSPKNLPSDSGPLRPVDGLSKAPLDIAGSVKLGQSVGFKEFKDFENDRGLPVPPGSVQVRLDPHGGLNLTHQTVGAEVVHADQSPVALSTSYLVMPVWAETASKPVATPSSELIAPIGVPISDQSKKSPSLLPDKPASAQAPSSATAPVPAAVSLPLPTPSAAQAIFQQTAQTATQPVAQFASIGVGFWDSRSPKNLPNDSGLLRPVDGLSKAPLDIAGSVKLGQSVGFKEFKDFENDRGLPVTPGSVQVRLDPHGGLNLTHQTVGAEVVHADQSPVALSTSNLVVPVWAETASKPVATPSSELIAPIGVPISDQSKKSPSVLPDKPASAQAPSSATAPLTAAVSLPLPTPSAAQAIFQQTAQTATQPVAQFASIGVGFWDNRSPKNLPNDSGLLRPVDGLSKAPLDIAGSVKLGQSVGFKEFKDFENDRGLTVTIGSSQISLDVHTGANLPQQVVGTEAVSPAFNQDAQWTSNLADTVNQWVERSLQLAELTVPDAGQDSLQVRIELNGQEATVYFLTDHAQYRDAIESQIENLSDRLADQGLKLAGSFVGQGSSQNSPQEQSAHSMLSRRHESEPASAKVLSIDPVLRDLKSVHQGRVLDVFA